MLVRSGIRWHFSVAVNGRTNSHDSVIKCGSIISQKLKLVFIKIYGESYEEKKSIHSLSVRRKV